MKRIALIADIHANLPALEMVICHAKEQKIDAIWNLGDSVGYGVFPNQVIQLLRQENIISLQGNYDLKVIRFPLTKKKFHKNKRPEKYQAFKWAYDTLTSDNRRFLASLPEVLPMQIEGKNILLAHGSPTSNEELITPETPKARLKELALIGLAYFPMDKRVDLVGFGHSHIPFSRFFHGVWFVNSGSVGRPDDGDPRSSYAIIEIDKQAISIQHFRIAYDVQRAVQAIRENHLPDAFAQMILHGQDLEGILAKPK
jgi:putative phosphoesterase